MRVAILSANACSYDAIGNLVAEKLRFFLRRGDETRVFLDSDHRMHPEVIPYASQAPDTRPAPTQTDFLLSVDLAVIEYGQSNRMLPILPVLAARGVRIVFCYHGITPLALWGSAHRGRIENASRDRAYAWCASEIWASSRFARDELVESTGIPRDRIQVMPLFVDASKLESERGERDVRCEFGLNDATILLFVGRVARNKRIPVLVDTLDRLREYSPPVHLLVVGDTSDVYEEEKRICLDRAARLRVADRIHFLGHVSPGRLGAAYRAADAFVTASAHEGFCIPVIEAMTCGIPVIGARSTALSETIGDSGLTFTPDKADDLARQVRRMVGESRGPMSSPQRDRYRIAIASARYGLGFVGGAESSLRTIGESLHHAGHHVEVYTTCALAEDAVGNELTPGDSEINGIPVRRFEVDSRDLTHFQRAFEMIRRANGEVAPSIESAYGENLLRSTALLQELRSRQHDFDALIVGPYQSGVAMDVAQAFGPRVILAPCFHDEPLARLNTWHDYYREVGAIWFHSPEEQAFAEADLGFCHPRAVRIGAWVGAGASGDPVRGRQIVGTNQRYLVYCGRYVEEKSLTLLLGHMRRYVAAHPGRFTLALMGQGSVPIPNEAWALNLGFVSHAAKHDVLAGADALVQPSRNESLSLVALEAWGERTPVLASASCAVIAGHVERSAGGRLFASHEEFAAALDDLWRNPADWRTLGANGQRYVAEHFGSQTQFVARLTESLRELHVPLGEQMRRRGFSRSARFSVDAYHKRMESRIAEIVRRPETIRRSRIQIEPLVNRRHATLGAHETLIPVRVRNIGDLIATPVGPARSILHVHVSGPGFSARKEIALGRLLAPGATAIDSLPVPVPDRPGAYRITFDCGVANEVNETDDPILESVMDLHVTRSDEIAGTFAALSAEVHQRLAAARELAFLPDDYVDVSLGRLARWKAWLKAKLLGNFKRAYVDVLSRQQTEFNQQVLQALAELTEAVAIMDSAVARLCAKGQTPHVQATADELHEQWKLGRGMRQEENSSHHCPSP